MQRCEKSTSSSYPGENFEIELPHELDRAAPDVHAMPDAGR